VLNLPAPARAAASHSRRCAASRAHARHHSRRRHSRHDTSCGLIAIRQCVGQKPLQHIDTRRCRRWPVGPVDGPHGRARRIAPAPVKLGGAHLDVGLQSLRQRGGSPASRLMRNNRYLILCEPAPSVPVPTSTGGAVVPTSSRPQHAVCLSLPQLRFQPNRDAS
jgi:hypothetical protein